LLADEKVRGENWDRLLEKHRTNEHMLGHLNLESPWNTIIKVSAYSTQGVMAEWWYRNVVVALTHGRRPQAAANRPQGSPASSSSAPLQDSIIAPEASPSSSNRQKNSRHNRRWGWTPPQKGKGKGGRGKGKGKKDGPKWEK
jgi:hypothetical protein